MEAHRCFQPCMYRATHVRGCRKNAGVDQLGHGACTGSTKQLQQAAHGARGPSGPESGPAPTPTHLRALEAGHVGLQPLQRRLHLAGHVAPQLQHKLLRHLKPSFLWGVHPQEEGVRYMLALIARLCAAVSEARARECIRACVGTLSEHDAGPLRELAGPIPSQAMHACMHVGTWSAHDPHAQRAHGPPLQWRPGCP